MAAPDPAADVRRALELEQQKSYTKIPNFFGDPGVDYFKPEEWIARVDTNRQAANWNDGQTLTIIFNALRGKALTWYMVMRQRGLQDFNTFNGFRALFLETFSAARTSKAVVGIFHGLNQQPKESVLDFFNRVGKASDDMTTLRPPLQDPAAGDWTAAFTAIEGWGAFDAAAKTEQGLSFMRKGATATMEHVSVQLFIAGLKQAIREQLLTMAPENGYNNLWAACRAALEIEKNIKEPSAAIKLLQPTGAVIHAAEATKETEIASAPDMEQYSEEEIAMLRKYPNLFRGRFRGRGRGRGGRGGQSNNRGSSNSSGPTKCFNCNETGHWARECPKPKKDRKKKINATEASRSSNEDDHEESSKQAAEIEYHPFQSYPAWSPNSSAMYWTGYGTNQ